MSEPNGQQLPSGLGSAADIGNALGGVTPTDARTQQSGTVDSLGFRRADIQIRDVSTLTIATSRDGRLPMYELCSVQTGDRSDCRVAGVSLGTRFRRVTARRIGLAAMSEAFMPYQRINSTFHHLLRCDALTSATDRRWYDQHWHRRSNCSKHEFAESPIPPTAPEQDPHRRRARRTLLRPRRRRGGAGAGAGEAEALSRLGAEGGGGRGAHRRVARAASAHRAGHRTAQAHPRRTPPPLGGRPTRQVQGQGPRAAEELEGEIQGTRRSGHHQPAAAAGGMVLGNRRSSLLRDHGMATPRKPILWRRAIRPDCDLPRLGGSFAPRETLNAAEFAVEQRSLDSTSRDRDCRRDDRQYRHCQVALVAAPTV